MKIVCTIIIPHKNAPELLRRCLDSIPSREDIQVIVVDDDSNPDVVDFAHFPGLNDPYTEIYFTKEGRRAGYARNVGLKKARGKWIIFADADDFFTGNLTKLIDRHKDSESDMICFTSLSVYSDDTDRPSKRDHNNKRILRFLENPDVQAEQQLRYGIPEPWGKMIRTSLLSDHSIVFEESMVANDYRFSLETGHAAGSLYAEPEPIYTVTHRENSLSSQKLSFPLIKTRIHIFCRAHSFFRENSIPPVREHFRYTMIWMLRCKPHWYIRICAALIRQDRKNIVNLVDAFRIMPRMIKEKTGDSERHTEK